MPFSRSRSIESITRSATSWLARKAPDCHSILSTRVVLPWSTWAMIATFRMSSRVFLAGATNGPSYAAAIDQPDRPRPDAPGTEIELAGLDPDDPDDDL